MAHTVKRILGSRLRDNGAEFCVWAPFAKQVSVGGNFAEGLFAMERDDEGYWSLYKEGVEAGNSYSYFIDTGSTTLQKNDPYARQLTASEKGMSVVVDFDFDWEHTTNTSIPFNEQVIYEMHIGTFYRPDAATPGTFSDAIEKLDYLSSLGVNMIELMPITSMAFANGWGYAPNHLFSVENTYGGRYGLMSFVKACHERGIGVILDVVYNHFSAESDLWQFDGWSKDGHGGIYFYNDDRGDTPWGSRPDYGRPEVRQFILDNVVMWLTEYKLDGLRVDSTIYMRNSIGANNDPSHDIGEAWSLMGEITSLAHKINTSAIVIAEDMSGNEYLTKEVEYGGCGFSAQWELGFPHVIRDALGLTGRTTLDGVIYALTHSFNLDAFKRVVFSDSHDTAANGGTRLAEAITPGNPGSVSARQKTMLANALILTSPGIPMLLQGQEFMQEGAFNDWRELDWPKTKQFAGVVHAHSDLIKLRLNTDGNTKGLTGQSLSVFHHDEQNMVLGYHRWAQGGPKDDVIVLVNFGNGHFTDYTVTLPVGGVWKVRYNSSWKGYSPDFGETDCEEFTTDDNGTVSVPFAPLGVLILSRDE